MLSRFSPEMLALNFPLGKGKKLFQDQERLIVKHAFFSSLSQREIIEKTKIPQQTVSRVVKSLLDRQVLVQVNKSSDGSRGQPGYSLKCNPNFAYSIGIGILTDSIGVAIMDFRGQVLVSDKLFLGSMKIETVMPKLLELYQRLLQQSDIEQEKILGIGVGISGYFTRSENGYDKTINAHWLLNEWAEVDICELISGAFNLPCWLENDAKAAAAGEDIVGTDHHVKSFVYMFISTGFGGGVIIDNEIFRGNQGNAGEFGQMIPPRMFIHPNLENLRQILIKNGVEIETVEDLVSNYDPNWPGIDEWVIKVKDSISLVASATSAILDTEAIVLGGHAPKALSQLLAAEIEIFDQHRRDIARPKPKIFVSDNCKEPVAIGAASIPFRELCL